MYIFKHGVPSFNREARGYCIIYYAHDKKYFCDNRYLLLLKVQGQEKPRTLKTASLFAFISSLIWLWWCHLHFKTEGNCICWSLIMNFIGFYFPALNALSSMIFFCRKKMSMCFDEDTCTVMCIKTSKSSVDFNLLANLALEMRIVY